MVQRGSRRSVGSPCEIVTFSLTQLWYQSDFNVNCVSVLSAEAVPLLVI